MSIITRTDVPPRPRLCVRFSAGDLLNTATFAIILPVVTYAIGMLGIASPLAWVCTVLLHALVSGIGYHYVTAADTLLTPPVLGVVALIVLIAGLGRGLLGSAIHWKHVVRVGLA